MSYRTTFVFSMIGFLFILLDLKCHLGASLFCMCTCSVCACHDEITEMVPTVLLFAGAGVAADYAHHLLRRKEREKTQVYRQTMCSMNHLVRSLQSKFILLSSSEAVEQEFGRELAEVLSQSSAQIETILERLALLDDVRPEMIRKEARLEPAP